MEIYSKRRRVGKKLVMVDYPVYTTREALDKRILFYAWRDAPGSRTPIWVLDDTGFVSRAERVQEFTDSRGYSRKQVHFLWKPRYVSSKPFGWSLRDIEAEKNYTWEDVEGRKSRMRRVIRVMATIRLAGPEPTDEEWVALGNLYRPKEALPIASLKRTLKKKKFHDMIREDIVTLLNERGITNKDVIDNYEEIRQSAMTSGKLAVAKSVVDVYRDMLDIHVEKVTSTTEISGEIDIAKAYRLLQKEETLELEEINGIQRLRELNSKGNGSGEGFGVPEVSPIGETNGKFDSDGKLYEYIRESGEGYEEENDEDY